MTRHLRPADDDLPRALVQAVRLFLFLDFDGTLAPIAPTPADAAPLPETAAILAALVAQPGLQVAIVSGRPIDDVRRLLDIPAVYYIGVHGAELCVPDGAVRLTEGAEMLLPVMAEIRDRLQAGVGTRPGILIEDKGVAVACHYRLADVADAVAARAAVTELVADYQRQRVPITASDGHAVCEIRPSGIDKGSAVYALLAVAAPDALPVYIGDDATDEDAFAALPSTAITVHVGTVPPPTRARYWVDSPAAVQAFLRTLLAVRTHQEPLRGGQS